MFSSDKAQFDTRFELSIELMRRPSIMGRYTHVLKVRYEGIAMDPGRVLYVSLSHELGVTDLSGQLMWYRGGSTYTYVNDVLVSTPVEFSSWVSNVVAGFRTHLSV